MDRRIYFRRAAREHDGLQIVEAWANHGMPVWAGRMDVSDSERAVAGTVYAELAARFTVRSSAFTRDLTPKDRLVHDGREWQILGIKELGRRDLLEITATVRTDG